MVLIYSRNVSSPSASIFCGVSATWNSVRVARLTPASVACAERTTATRSVNGLRCSSSPFGSGLALRNRSNASRTSAGVHGLTTLSLDALGLDVSGLGFLTAPADAALAATCLRGFVAREAAADFDLADGRRVILGMVLIY